MQPNVGISECRLVVLVVARIEGVDSKTEILPYTSSRWPSTETQTTSVKHNKTKGVEWGNHEKYFCVCVVITAVWLNDIMRMR